MQEIAVASLKEGQSWPNGLYFISGDEILPARRAIGAPLIQTLHDCGIDALLQPDDRELHNFSFQCRHKTITVDELKPGTRLPVPIFNHHDELLLQAGVEISTGIIDQFRRRNIFELFTKRNAEELQLAKLQAFRDRMEGSAGKARAASAAAALNRPELAHKLAEAADPRAACSVTIVDQLAESGIDAIIKPGPDPLDSKRRAVSPDEDRGEEIKIAYTSKYDEIERLVNQLFDIFRSQKQTHIQTVRKLCSDIIHALIHDKDLLLNMANRHSREHYLSTHCVNVACLSMNIGAAMGLSETQVFELGHAAFLSDVGMLRVDPHIVNKAGKLTNLERLEIEKHVGQNLNLLQFVRGLPAIVPLVVYQTHERLDRGGYPKNRPAKLIHQYAKIIMIADIFDSLCSERPYRPAMHPYLAMETILKMSGSQKLDPAAVRGFLSYVSLFPVGSWVETSTGYIGKVIAANPAEYTKPVLRLLYHDGRVLEDRLTLDLAKNPAVKIARYTDAPNGYNDIMTGF